MKMAKHLVFMCLIFNLVSCGQKSVIKTDVKPKTLAETNSYKVPAKPAGYTHVKDKNLLWTTTSLPITTDPLASPVPDTVLLGGLVKFFANIGVALGVGRTEMYFHQPTPELPDQAKEIRISRIFFYIEPAPNTSRRAHWLSRIFRGKGDVDFDFMKHLVLRVKPEVADMRNVCLLPDQGELQPQFPCDGDVKNVRTAEFLSLFKAVRPQVEPNLAELDQFVILKYKGGKDKNKYLMNELRGSMYMFRTKNPGELYRFVNSNPTVKNVITNMMTLDKVVLVEVAKNALAKETFEIELSKNATVLDAKVGVEQIEECTPSICLDVRLEEANLLPFLKRFNSNRVEAFVDAGRVPETFQLKGFIDIDLGIGLNF
jgi:hypothetical protein